MLLDGADLELASVRVDGGVLEPHALCQDASIQPASLYC